jgi:hypothetical protein
MDGTAAANFYWDCKAHDNREASVYVVTDRVTILIERTPIRMAERIVRTHNRALMIRDGITLEQFPKLCGRCHPP